MLDLIDIIQITAALLILAIGWYSHRQPKIGLSCGILMVYLMTIVLLVVLAIAAWGEHHTLNVAISLAILLILLTDMYQKRHR